MKKDGRDEAEGERERVEVVRCESEKRWSEERVGVKGRAKNPNLVTNSRFMAAAETEHLER